MENAQIMTVCIIHQSTHAILNYANIDQNYLKNKAALKRGQSKYALNMTKQRAIQPKAMIRPIAEHF
jgi:hypothetical protein